MFTEIHQRYPDAHILHLAYSAVTTVSYQSAVIAAEGLDYVTSLDTKHVSAGQAAVVLETARLLECAPMMEPAQAIEAASAFSRRARMCFLPRDLAYLRAGGRVSNVVCLGGKLLNLHPCIEILDGYLLAKKKYRGNLLRVVPELIREYTRREQLEKSLLYLLASPGLPEPVQQAAEQTASACGFQEIQWMRTGGVITTHGGPGCFGLAGFSEMTA